MVLSISFFRSTDSLVRMQSVTTHNKFYQVSRTCTLKTLFIGEPFSIHCPDSSVSFSGESSDYGF